MHVYNFFNICSLTLKELCVPVSGFDRKIWKCKHALRWITRKRFENESCNLLNTGHTAT